MCGIVGAIAERPIEPILLEGLKRLEYRGYDSAGMAILSPGNNFIQRKRVHGKVAALEKVLLETPLLGKSGIAHTRWATHGKPSEQNAHPHTSHDEIAIVHNGIIENYQALRKSLLEKNYPFESETDSEVIVHLLHHNICNHQDMMTALRKTAQTLQRAYALCILSKKEPQKIYAIRS